MFSGVMFCPESFKKKAKLVAHQLGVRSPVEVRIHSPENFHARDRFACFFTVVLPFRASEPEDAELVFGGGVSDRGEPASAGAFEREVLPLVLVQHLFFVKLPPLLLFALFVLVVEGRRASREGG